MRWGAAPGRRRGGGSPVLQQQRGGRGEAAELAGALRDRRREPGPDLDPGARQLDRRADQPAPGERAEAAMRLPQPGDRAGDADASGPATPIAAASPSPRAPAPRRRSRASPPPARG
jgi:hypothetical protein